MLRIQSNLANNRLRLNDVTFLKLEIRCMVYLVKFEYLTYSVTKRPSKSDISILISSKLFFKWKKTSEGIPFVSMEWISSSVYDEKACNYEIETGYYWYQTIAYLKMKRQFYCTVNFRTPKKSESYTIILRLQICLILVV